MGDEGIVALGLRRYAAPEALVLVRTGVLRTPLVEREGRVGEHHVEAHEVVTLHQSGAVQGIAPFDAGGVTGMQKHVHARQRPGRPVHLLPVEGEVLRPDFLRRLDQQRAGAAGRITDRAAGPGGGELCQQAGDRSGRVELARLLACIGCEAGDQVDVALTDDVRAHAAGAQVHRGLGEVLQQVLQAAVPVLRAAQVGLRIEVDVAEHALQLGAVGVLDPLQGDVDQFADIGLVPLGVQVLEAGAFGQDKAFTLQSAANAVFIPPVSCPIVRQMIVPEIGDVLQEQHHKDVVLVLPGIDDTPKSVAGRPGRVVDLLLGDPVGHRVVSRCCVLPCCGACIACAARTRLWNLCL